MARAAQLFVTGILLALALPLSSCNALPSLKSQNKQSNGSSSAGSDPSIPDSDRREVVIETRPIDANMTLECEAWDLPMIDRFPAHILLNGVKSEKLFLRRDWMVWYFIPVFLGSIKSKEPSCEVNQSAKNNGQQIQCRYGGGLLQSERLLTIPLLASNVAIFYGNDSKPFHTDWFVLGATLAGKNVYRGKDEVKLTCMPRSQEFGYETLSEKDVKKVQPWDRTF